MNADTRLLTHHRAVIVSGTPRRAFGFKTYRRAPPITIPASAGVTLIELAVVLFVLIALAGLAVPFVSNSVNYAECMATDTALQNVRTAIMGSATTPAFYSDMNRMPYSLAELTNCSVCQAYNSVTRHGWRGPYLSNGYNDDFIDRTSGQGTAMQLALAFDGANCGYLLVSNGPDHNTDTPLPAVSGTSSPYTPNCPNISDATMNGLVAAGARYLDTGASAWDKRDGNNGGGNDDRLLFIGIPDPGSNAPCS